MNKELSLFKLNENYEKLLSQLYDQETGEVNEEVDAQLNALSTSIEDKCKSVGTWIGHMQAEKNRILEMKMLILEREKAYEREIEKTTEYLKSNMERHKIKKITCPYFTITHSINPYGTEIIDEALIPQEFIKTREIVKTESKPDRNAIKESVLKTGIQIPGAIVSQKTKIKFVINKI